MGELGFLKINCDIIRFISLLLLGMCDVCSHGVVLGLSVRLSCYPIWMW